LMVKKIGKPDRARGPKKIQFLGVLKLPGLLGGRLLKSGGQADGPGPKTQRRGGRDRPGVLAGVCLKRSNRQDPHRRSKKKEGLNIRNIRTRGLTVGMPRGGD